MELLLSRRNAPSSPGRDEDAKTMAITEYRNLLSAQCEAVLARLRDAHPSHLQNLHNERRKVEAALDRVEAGTYGICCQCDEAMTPERLKADPAAPFCQECIDDRAPARMLAR